LLPLPTPYSTAIWGWASWVAGFALMFWGRYKAVERLSKPLVVLLGGCLAAAALLSKPDVGALVTGALTPTMPESRGLYGPFLVMIAVMSAAAGSTGNLKYSAYVHERGWRDTSFLRAQRIDLVLMMTDAYHRHLRPSRPDASSDPNEGSAHLTAFRWLTLYTFLSPLYVFMTDWNPIGLVLAQSASSVLGLPVIIFIILRLTSNRKVMGEQANGWLTNVILAAAALTTVYLGIEAGLEFLQGSR
jgi:Mn2+/Fe2+ NRAMP family transporter